MVLLLAALLASSIPAPQEQTAVNAAEVTRALDENDALLTEYERRLTHEALVEAEPQIGAEVYSEESPNEVDAFHHARVASVYTAGPADAAGIRPGDRIVAIGSRRLEHETDKVLKMLISQARNPIQLTIQHADEPPVTVSVERKPLACVARAVSAIDKAPFLLQIEDLRITSRQMRELLQKEPTRPDILEMAEVFIAQFQQMLLKVNADVLNALHQSVVVTCGVRSVDR